MKKQGFTIIELLATIVILAITSVIVFPIITDFVEQSKYNTAKNNASGLLDAARNYHALEMADKGITESVTITFPEGDKKLDYHGKTPKSGSLTIDVDGKVTLQVEFGKYCATKKKTTDKVTVKEKGNGTCTIG